MNTKERMNHVKDFIRQPFAWPGGYQKILIMADGEPLCHQCACENYKLIAHDTRRDNRGSWAAYCSDIHWEGTALQCANCNNELPSEYGDNDE